MTTEQKTADIEHDPRAYASYPPWDSCKVDGDRALWGCKMVKGIAERLTRRLSDAEELESALYVHLAVALRESSICSWGLLYNRLWCKALNERDKMRTVARREKNNFSWSGGGPGRDM